MFPGNMHESKDMEKTKLLSGSFGRENLASRCAQGAVHGCFGECTALAVAGEPISSQGTLFVLIEYLLFVLLSLSGRFKAPKNISICGSKRFTNGSVSIAKKNPVKATQPSMII